MSDNPRIDPLYEDGPVFGAKRQALLARCDELARTIAEHDRELERIVKDRRTAAQELRAHRRRLFRRLPWPGRQPRSTAPCSCPPFPSTPPGSPVAASA
ncbi:MAG: hypothetical protein AB7O92_14755 [Acidimicrobiia bacterium]